jgi:hypothetical protein
MIAAACALLAHNPLACRGAHPMPRCFPLQHSVEERQHGGRTQQRHGEKEPLVDMEGAA